MDHGEPLLVLAHEWIAHPRELDREEGLAELAARYVASHGPATADDLAWWSGLGKRDVREALALAGDRVVRIEADGGTAYWIAPELADAVGHGPPPAGVALLPAFDDTSRRSADPAPLREAADGYARYLGRRQAKVVVAE